MVPTPPPPNTVVEASAPSVTTAQLGMNKGDISSASSKERVGQFLLNLDELWAAEGALSASSRKFKAENSPKFHCGFISQFTDGLFTALLNLYASVNIYLRYLITVESALCVVVSIGATLMYSLYEVKGHRLGVNVSWAFISFAIIFPLTNSLNETFKRREKALGYLAEVKAFLLSYFMAHRDWDWGKNGRQNLPKNHVQVMRFICCQLVCDMRDLLTAPSTSRQIHLFTKKGRQQRHRMQSIQREITQRIMLAFQKLSMAVEELKYAGQPGNESSRMRQYITLTMKAWENLRYIKRYRTPVATRAFARVYIFLHPFFWGPYYSSLISQMLEPIEEDPIDPGVPMYTLIMVNVYACLLSAFTSLAMMGLFNVRYRLEDPFCGDLSSEKAESNLGADQVQVNQEMAELVHAMTMEFMDAKHEDGGGPPSSIWPVAKVCNVADLEMGHRIPIDAITMQFERASN